MTSQKCVALIAHDQKKDDIAAFAKANEAVLARWKIVATGTTGGRVQEACPSLDVIRMKSGPLGGDQQIGALIATGEVHMLMRLATVYDIPMALNRATAEQLIDFHHP
jgi:methylglyoxal synthase